MLRKLMYLTDFSNCDSKFNEITKAFDDEKNIDIFLNAAGNIRKSKFLEITESDWDTVLDINLKSMYFMLQIFAKYIIKNNYEVSISLMLVRLALKPGWNPYTISKSGIQSLTLGLYGASGTLDICKSHS